MFRPFKGRSTMRLFSTTALRVEEDGSIICAPAATSICCVTAPNSMRTFTVALCCVNSGTLSSTYSRNPGLFARRL